MIYIYGYLFIGVLFIIACVAMDMNEFQGILDELGNRMMVPIFAWPVFVALMLLTSIFWPVMLPMKIKNRIKNARADKETKHETND